MTAMQYTMKDSGVPWIGEIPEHWGTMRFNNAITRMSTGLNPRTNFELSKDFDLFYVTIQNFKDGKLYLDDKCDRISQDAWAIIQNRSQLLKGDILFASISKEAQAYILDSDPVNWNINESVFCIRVAEEYFVDKYFYYQLINASYYSSLSVDATGTTFQSIKQGKLRKSILACPSLPEQEVIAAYLDEKCGAIDEIIAKAKATIEEYKAWKGSVIFEAVTKGLDPNAEMKDSGVEWIGSVPKGWRTNKVRSCAIFLNGDRSENYPKPEEFVDYGVPFISSYNIEYDVLDVSIHPKFITEQKYNALRGAKLSINDIVFCLRGSIGKCAINLTETQGALASSLVVIRCTGMSSKFLLYVLLSQIATVQTEICMNGTCAANLSAENVAGYIIPVPSTEEQNAIVIFLDRQCSAIDAIIGEKQTLIDDLDAYKKSLIFETVTGKRRVV